jgi:plasmid stabilization system protein ParE
VTHRIAVRQLAEQDLLEAQVWYTGKNPNLGDRFRSSVDRVLQLLGDSPLIFPSVYGKVRRASIEGFPYLLYYVVLPDRVSILGCFHARRNPQIVLRRIKSDS